MVKNSLVKTLIVISSVGAILTLLLMGKILSLTIFAVNDPVLVLAYSLIITPLVYKCSKIFFNWISEVFSVNSRYKSVRKSVHELHKKAIAVSKGGVP